MRTAAAYHELSRYPLLCSPARMTPMLKIDLAVSILRKPSLTDLPDRG
jgi:hypothetical protein